MLMWSCWIGSRPDAVGKDRIAAKEPLEKDVVKICFEML